MLAVSKGSAVVFTNATDFVGTSDTDDGANAEENELTGNSGSGTIENRFHTGESYLRIPSPVRSILIQASNIYSDCKRGRGARAHLDRRQTGCSLPQSPEGVWTWD